MQGTARKQELTEVPNTMVQAKWEQSQKLEFGNIPTGNHRFGHLQERLEDIHSFLSGVEWQLGTQEEPNGVTWLELFAIFELMGGDRRWTERGERERMRQAKEEYDRHYKRWAMHANKK